MRIFSKSFKIFMLTKKNKNSLRSELGTHNPLSKYDSITRGQNKKNVFCNKVNQKNFN